MVWGTAIPALVYKRQKGFHTSGDAATLLAAAAISAMPFCAITTSCTMQQSMKPAGHQGSTSSQASSQEQFVCKLGGQSAKPHRYSCANTATSHLADITEDIPGLWG